MGVSAGEMEGNGYGVQNDGGDVPERGGRGNYSLHGVGLRGLEHRALLDEGMHELLAPECKHESIAIMVTGS